MLCCCFFFFIFFGFIYDLIITYTFMVFQIRLAAFQTHTHSFLSIVIVIWYFCLVYGKKIVLFFSDTTIANAKRNLEIGTKWWRRKLEKKKTKPSNTKEFCKCRTNLWNVWNSVIYLCIQVAIIANPINRLMHKLVPPPSLLPLPLRFLSYFGSSNKWAFVKINLVNASVSKREKQINRRVLSD